MPSENLKIFDFGEKKLIKRLLSRSQKFPFKSNFFDPLSLESLGDDAALVDFKDKYLVITSDLLLKSAHLPDKMSFRQIGKKIITVNASDLAAMGAAAIGITVALGLPSNLLLSDFDELVDGMLEACEQYNMALIGGDTNESEELTLCGTAIGIISKKEVLMKSGATPGDILAVTGPLGLAAAGFEILLNPTAGFQSLNPELKNQALKQALEPEAQLNKGICLAKTGDVTSATDITDGLASELDEIINAGEGIGVTIYEDMILIPAEVTEVAGMLDKNPLELALYYGEDFELLVTIKRDKFNYLKDQINLHQIGYVDSSGVISMVNKDGKTDIIPPRGYEHFKDPKKN